MYVCTVNTLGTQKSEMKLTKYPAGPIEDFPDDWVCPQCAAGIEGIITEDE